MIEITIGTRHTSEMVDITEEVREAVIKKGIKSGLVAVFTPHTTCSLNIPLSTVSFVVSITILLVAVAVSLSNSTVCPSQVTEVIPALSLPSVKFNL